MEKIPSSSSVLVEPKPWTVLLLGIYHEQAIVLILVISLAPIGVLFIWREILPGWAELALMVLSLILISGVARHHLAAPFTRLLKRWFASRVRVVYFRSFRQDASHEARDHLGPILGCIGCLTTVHNTAYVQGLTPVEGHSDHDDLWFAWLELGEILSDGLEAVKLEDAHWRENVLEILRKSDLAIIDLTEATENVAWEFARALEVLPANRVVPLYRAGTSRPQNAPHALEYDTAIRGRYRLRQALRRRLSAIRHDSSL